MKDNLTPVLPGELIQNAIGWKSIAWWPYPSVDLGDEENKSEDKHPSKLCAEAVCRRLETQGYGGDGKIFPLRTSVEPIYPEEPIARANGIGGEEPTFEGIRYGDIIPANPTADHKKVDYDLLSYYLRGLKEGERVVECGVCATTGHKGTIRIKKGSACVEWDAVDGGVMTTSLTGGTRRISDVITESPKPDEASKNPCDCGYGHDGHFTGCPGIRYDEEQFEKLGEPKPTPPKPGIPVKRWKLDRSGEGPDKMTQDKRGAWVRFEAYESDLAAARAEISGLEEHFKIVRDDRDRAVAFANRIERGEVRFEGLAQKELKKILTLGLAKDINEGLGDVVVREIQRLRAALEAFERCANLWLPEVVDEEHADAAQALHALRDKMLAALSPASSGKGEG